jgi:hypothetical protein
LIEYIRYKYKFNIAKNKKEEEKVGLAEEKNVLLTLRVESKRREHLFSFG